MTKIIKILVRIFLILLASPLLIPLYLCMIFITTARWTWQKDATWLEIFNHEFSGYPLSGFNKGL